MSLKIAFRF